jgi:hypothetical protein
MIDERSSPNRAKMPERGKNSVEALDSSVEHDYKPGKGFKLPMTPVDIGK